MEANAPGLTTIISTYGYHNSCYLTVDDSIAVTKCSRMTSMYSTGGDTAEMIYKTAELYLCNSELSLSSDIRRISGLRRYYLSVCCTNAEPRTSWEQHMGILGMLERHELRPRSTGALCSTFSMLLTLQMNVAYGSIQFCRTVILGLVSTTITQILFDLLLIG